MDRGRRAGDTVSAAASGLSTHVLDVARGVPGAHIEVGLFRSDGAVRTPIAHASTDAGGRIAGPFGGPLEPGWYELVFMVEEYFKRLESASFYNEITVRFRIDEGTAHYHVPLLLAPYGYSTYRGS
ncbi:MAG: hydroxyisourate hydrolase [Vulcanimicrobiaceae bacterium]